MDTSQCKTPVVFIVFNRPQHTEAVFRRIAQARPPCLLVVADGPRPNKPGEAALCAKVRQIATQVDWPCEVLTNFSDVNLGCGMGPISGLNWAFEKVEEAIILEDDILPDVSFFRFCDEMLERFRNDSRISMITGFNVVQDHVPMDWSYYYSQITHCWGWATWRRSWARYDQHLKHWPAVKAAGLMREYFARPDSDVLHPHLRSNASAHRPEYLGLSVVLHQSHPSQLGSGAANQSDRKYRFRRRRYTYSSGAGRPCG